MIFAFESLCAPILSRTSFSRSRDREWIPQKRSNLPLSVRLGLGRLGVVLVLLPKAENSGFCASDRGLAWSESISAGDRVQLVPASRDVRAHDPVHVDVVTQLVISTISLQFLASVFIVRIYTPRRPPGSRPRVRLRRWEPRGRPTSG